MNLFRLTQLLEVGLLSAVCWTTYAADQLTLTVKDLLDMPLEELMQVQVVSEATGSKQPISKAPAIVKIITAEDIKAMGATDLDEVLETVPELHVTRNIEGYQSNYVMRGMYSSLNPEVMLLINNIPMNTIQYGGRPPRCSGMSVNGIARIEVIRGSGAAVHANAFAGVINIVTKTKTDLNGTETGLRLGNFNTKNIWVSHGQEYAGFDVMTSWEYSSTDGPHQVIEADRQTLLDKQFGTHASLAPSALNVPRDSHDIRLDVSHGAWRWRTGLHLNNNLGTGISAGNALDPKGRYNAYYFGTDVTYQQPQLTENWEVNAQLSYLNLKDGSEGFITLLPPGAFLAKGAYPNGRLMSIASAEQQWRFIWSNFYKGVPNHLGRVELGYTQSDVYKVTQLRNFDVYTNLPTGHIIDVSDTPAAATPERGRQSTHLLLQDAWTFSPTWELTAGLRYYNFSDFGQTVNPLLGLVWQTRPNLVSKLLYGKAFRAPDLRELYTTTGMGMGNPNLKPEVIHTTELALEYQPQDTVTVNFDLFTYRVKDVILLNLPLPSGKTQFQNSGIHTGYGLGLETLWRINLQWHLTGNYTFQTATDQDHHAVPNAPRHKIYLRTDWKFLPHWNLDTQANWVGTRYRLAGDTRPPIDNYTTIDLTLRYQPEKQPWEVGLSVRNLFNEEAKEPTDVTIPNDLPLAGRSGWGEVRYRF